MPRHDVARLQPKWIPGIAEVSVGRLIDSNVYDSPAKMMGLFLLLKQNGSEFESQLISKGAADNIRREGTALKFRQKVDQFSSISHHPPRTPPVAIGTTAAVPRIDGTIHTGRTGNQWQTAQKDDSWLTNALIMALILLVAYWLLKGSGDDEY